MSNLEDSKIDGGEYKVKSSVVKKTYVFSWEIENLATFPTSFKITSHEFEPIKGQTFCATIENSTVRKGYYLSFVYNGNTSVEIKHRTVIADSAGNVWYTYDEYKHTYDTEHRTCEDMIESNKFEKQMGLTTNKIVVFKCYMEFGELVTGSETKCERREQIENLPNLREDFKKMLKDSIYADISLKVGEDVLKAHKSVLCARSPVFAKMLATPMGEKEKDTIDIDDINLPVLKAFIEFLYTGTLPDHDYETVYTLYYVADKYDVPSLRKTCSDVLFEKLDVENACSILSMANRHSDLQLKAKVLDFMQLEFDAILGTEDWPDFVQEETKLATEVMKLRGQACKKRRTI